MSSPLGRCGRAASAGGSFLLVSYMPLGMVREIKRGRTVGRLCPLAQRFKCCGTSLTCHSSLPNQARAPPTRF